MQKNRKTIAKKQKHTKKSIHHAGKEKETAGLVRRDDFTILNLGEKTIQSPLTAKQNFVDDTQRVLYNIRLNSQKKVHSIKEIYKNSFEKSGPRKKIFFQPSSTKVGIVTCGGLCPGMNAIIYGLVRQLWNRYEVKNTIGIRYGYRGLSNNHVTPIRLTPQKVEDIQFLGGSILGTSRGAIAAKEIVDNIVKNKINILFTIGGDGSMHGALAISEEIFRRGLKISIIGIPKTIDNDIPYVITSFGFETAVEKASETIMAAHKEARGHENGIGLVKVMGRNAGYIAAHATLSTGVADLCLIPEVPFSLSGQQGIITNLVNCFKKSSSAVIVVAEGAGRDLFKTPSQKKDPSGNIQYRSESMDIGLLLQKEITKSLNKKKIKFSLKYLDPSYFIRSSAPNCFDRVFCTRISQNAVHAGMSGKTSMLIGYWHGEMTHVPLRALSSQLKRINPIGTLWFNVLESTLQ